MKTPLVDAPARARLSALSRLTVAALIGLPLLLSSDGLRFQSRVSVRKGQ